MISSGSATLRSIVRHGIERRRLEHVAVGARSAAPRSGVMPLTRIVPPVGCSRSAMTRSSVVLPQPDGPISETNSPRLDGEVDIGERLDRAVAGVEGERQARRWR